MLQAQTGQVFHHIIKRAVIGAAVIVHLDGVPVRELGRRPDLEFEPGQDPGLLRQGWLDQLDGARALEELVLGKIDLAHAAGAELLAEPILIELPRPEGLGAKLVDRVRAEDRSHRPQDQEQGVLADVLEADGSALPPSAGIPES